MGIVMGLRREGMGNYFTKDDIELLKFLKKEGITSMKELKELIKDIKPIKDALAIDEIAKAYKTLITALKKFHSNLKLDK
ncbi:hypothetical protein KAT73_04080 [candidate division WOR-3 bacterium]|nr:hypothetical protein [candidate division WOR-3 bacterium]